MIFVNWVEGTSISCGQRQLCRSKDFHALLCCVALSCCRASRWNDLLYGGGGIHECLVSCDGKRMVHFPIKSCRFSGRFFRFSGGTILGHCISKRQLSRKSDAEAITITILFSMKPGWIWDGGRTPHFFMDHGVTLCCCSASIFLYKRYVLWWYVICVHLTYLSRLSYWHVMCTLRYELY